MNELIELLDKQRELIDLLGARARAFSHCYKAFSDRWEELVEEGQELIAKFESGEEVEKGIATETLIRTKVMREVVCFMGEALEKFEEGDEECSE